MRLSKQLRRTVMASAVAVLALSAAPAMAADTPFGTCVGDASTDCVAALAHTSVSVVTTLSINEERAISFGNIAATTPGAGDKIILGLDGSRTPTGTWTLLNGADGGATSGVGALETGSQSPGHYTVSGAGEPAASEVVYISFADSTGALIDMCDSAETGCDTYHPGAKVGLSGGDGLSVDHFFINQTGSDVYGHYIATGAASAPGITTPYDPTHTAYGANTASVVDVVVGARLASAGGALTAGKHVGNFNIMVSY